MGSIVNATSAYVEDNGGNKVSILQQRPFPETNYINKWVNSNLSPRPTINNNFSFPSTYNTGVTTANMTNMLPDSHVITMNELRQSPFNCIVFEFDTYSSDDPIQSQYSLTSNPEMSINYLSYDNFSVVVPINILTPNTTLTASICVAPSSMPAGILQKAVFFYFSLQTDGTGLPKQLSILGGNSLANDIGESSARNTVANIWNPNDGYNYYSFTSSNIQSIVNTLFNSPNSGLPRYYYYNPASYTLNFKLSVQ